MRSTDRVSGTDRVATAPNEQKTTNDRLLPALARPMGVVGNVVQLE